MNKIEIKTAQNVTIEYELASILYRSIAFLIDFIALGVVCSILSVFLAVDGFSDGLFNIILYFAIIPIISFYSLCFEYFTHGQSLGKMVMRLRVVKINGEKTRFLDYVMRWVFRVIDIYASAGTIAALGIITSSKNQRLGDFFANTVVLSLGRSNRMRIQNLLRLNEMRDYKPTYPQVTSLDEESMLIVKETIERYIKIRNYAHQQALKLLVMRLEKKLKVKAPENKVAFLKTLLKDYVVLTR